MVVAVCVQGQFVQPQITDQSVMCKPGGSSRMDGEKGPFVKIRLHQVIIDSFEKQSRASCLLNKPLKTDNALLARLQVDSRQLFPTCLRWLFDSISSEVHS